MTAKKISLEIIQVPDPCTQDWATMRGDDRIRFCGVCRKNVYNLSAMERSDAEALVNAREGTLCVRFFQRDDGTVVTADCSAIRKAARRARRALATASAAIIALIAGGFAARETKAEAAHLQGAMAPPPTSQPAPAPACNDESPLVIVDTSPMTPTEQIPPGGRMVMGDCPAPVH